MNVWTEEKIRQCLDGTFTRFDVIGGGVKTSQVPGDYIPTHHPSSCVPREGQGRGVPKSPYTRFTEAEDEMIIGFKARGHSAAQIARLLGRMDDAGINKRYRRLIKLGRCEAVVA